jgi:hypothetical protein
MYFPNLDELLFLAVLELPKASRTGLVLKILVSIGALLGSIFLVPSEVRKAIAILALSVLPAPDSPEITIPYLILFSIIYL